MTPLDKTMLLIGFIFIATAVGFYTLGYFGCKHYNHKPLKRYDINKKR